MKEKIILIGGGGHCRSCIDVIEQTNKFKIVGIVDKSSTQTEKILNYPILGDDGDLEELRQTIDHCLVTVGHIKSSKTRERIYNKLKSLNFHFPVIISPTSYVSRHAFVGEGTIIMNGSTVNAGAHIGNNCILNTHSLVEHSAIIGNHTHISTSAVVNGGASIGSRCFIGSNATIIQEATIPNDYFFRAAQLIISKQDGYLIVKE